MTTIAKERINKIFNKQPADSSCDEIMRELLFAKMIKKGLADVENGNVTSHEDMKNEIALW